MRILISAYSCCPYKGSEPGYGWNWAVELSKRNDFVYCYTRSIFKNEILAALLETGIINLQFIFVDPPNYFEKRYYSGKIGLYMHYLSWQWFAYKKAKSLQDIHSYELIHHVTMGSLQLGSFMYKLNIPFIFGPVGGGQHAPKKFKSYFGKYWKIEVARKYFSFILLLLNPGTKNTIRKAAVVLVNNKETESLAKKMGAKKVIIFFDTSLPQSFYPFQLPKHKFDEELKILWTGRLLPRKGLLLVLESLALIKNQLNFKLTIAGDGEMGIYVNEWISQLGLKEQVNWIGQIPFEDVKQQYADANLFILTSLRDSCPLQLLEAMAYGLPIITLDLHGAAIAVPDDAGIKIKTTTPLETKYEIAKAIKYLSNNPEKLRELGRNGYKYALEQTWEKRVQHIVNTVY